MSWWEVQSSVHQHTPWNNDLTKGEEKDREKERSNRKNQLEARGFEEEG